ncbi:hypothetical protein LK994_12775 [Ferruginibacter lapsinanis]|uniref:hypothetical protein n=1 Tax=Ferruginibacter lapsinanis TaxID=563172 RepID=UPI001E362AA9|nr:hypothetical protein [Ferruginibacter lapsinanis]UEG49508.1 hypothetical protein LK994_12775 [Ferruginibacter lapsinanis]
MKNLLQILVHLFFFMFIATLSVVAQKKMIILPAVFNSYPSIINCTSAELNNFFSIQKGGDVNISFNNLLRSKGSVISNQKKYINLQTIVVRLPEFNNAVFSLSKRIDKNRNVIYSGRIINQLNSDGYELKHNSDNSYQFTKFALADILSDCN